MTSHKVDHLNSKRSTHNKKRDVDSDLRLLRLLISSYRLTGDNGYTNAFVAGRDVSKSMVTAQIVRLILANEWGVTTEF